MDYCVYFYNNKIKEGGKMGNLSEVQNGHLG